MPNIIPISEIKAKLPSFVQIIDSTYRGTRYKCSFIDTEYNERFEAVPCSVIKLQYGCKSRADKRRADNANFKGPGHKTPIAEVLARLAPHLTMDESTYRGVRESAIFYDREQNLTIKALVCNVIRYGKGYFGERKERNFRERVSVPLSEIQERVKELYGEELAIIPESYIDTNSMVKIVKKDGEIVATNAALLLLGKYGEGRRQHDRWKRAILKNNPECKVCGSTSKRLVHHLYGWQAYPHLRFEEWNGVCLCIKCHNEFHRHYTKHLTKAADFFDWLGRVGTAQALELKAQLLSNKHIQSPLLQSRPASKEIGG